MTDHDHDHDGSIWIRTESALDGDGYRVTVELTEDRAVGLEPTGGIRYAAAVLAAAARASYDAAVARQMRERLGLTVAEAAQVVADLRDTRPPLDTAATAPLTLEPGVAASDGTAFLRLLVNGRPIGQWEPAQARGHAMMVLEAMAVAEDDGRYTRVLTGIIGVDPEKAAEVVEDLGRWRDDDDLQADT